MAKPAQQPLSLALQGGGAHGAFAWGVLDYLLEDNRVDFAGITAASAGAMNAAVMTYGLTVGGADGAREHLDRFWQEVSKVKSHMGIFSNPLLDAIPEWQQASDWFNYAMMETFVHAISPYQFNPMKIDPLRDILTDIVDFGVLQQCERSRLYVSATNVRTGRIKVFKTHEITADTIMASACLPYLFQAVEIDGEAYWDGGYMGNPALFPFFDGGGAQDILLVQINPVERSDVPRTATVSAASEVVALRIAKDRFFTLIDEFPEMAVEMLRELARRLEVTTVRLREAHAKLGGASAE